MAGKMFVKNKKRGILARAQEKIEKEEMARNIVQEGQEQAQLQIEEDHLLELEANGN